MDLDTSQKKKKKRLQMASKYIEKVEHTNRETGVSTILTKMTKN